MTHILLDTRSLQLMTEGYKIQFGCIQLKISHLQNMLTFSVRISNKNFLLVAIYGNMGDLV